MRRRRYYEAQAWPDGRYEARFVNEGTSRTIVSGTVRPENTPIGSSLLAAAEMMAQCAIDNHKRDSEEQARLGQGSINWTVGA